LRRFAEPFLRGTFAPERRASDSPIAIACFRLVTFFPEPPLRSLPRFRSCIARLTLLCAFFPYFAMASHFESCSGERPANGVPAWWIVDSDRGSLCVMEIAAEPMG
jgi:hypothetical protein